MGVIQDIDAAIAFVENVATVGDLVKLGASIAKKMRDAGVAMPQATLDQELQAAEAVADAVETAKVGKP